MLLISEISFAPECKEQPAFKIVFDGKTKFFVPEDAQIATEIIGFIERNRIRPSEDYLNISMYDMSTEIWKTNNCLILLAKHKVDNSMYVIKRYSKFNLDNKNVNIEEYTKEFLTFMNPFVSTLKYVPSSQGDIFLIYEYVEKGILFGKLLKDQIFNESTAAFYASEILLGLSYLHQHKGAFGKLAPNSILISNDGHIKIADPGLSIGINEYNEYTAPELISQIKELNSSATIVIPKPETDFYSFGLIIYYMICGMPPFFDDDKKKQDELILENHIRFPRHVSQDAKELIKALMNKDPSKRLTDFETIKSYKFFQNINWNLILSKAISPPWKPEPEYKCQNMIEAEKNILVV